MSETTRISFLSQKLLGNADAGSTVTFKPYNSKNI